MLYQTQQDSDREGLFLAGTYAPATKCAQGFASGNFRFATEASPRYGLDMASLVSRDLARFALCVLEMELSICA